MMRYTAVFEFDGSPPAVNKKDGWKGGKLCAVSFQRLVGRIKEQ